MNPLQNHQTTAAYVTVPGVADILSVTPDALCSRLRRGNLRREQSEVEAVSILWGD
jgi:hypothetical protein